MKAVLLILDIFTVLIQKTVCEKLFLRKNKTNVFEAAVWMSFFMLSDFLTYILIPSVFANAVIFCVLFSVVLLLLYEGSLKRKIMITVFMYFLGMGTEFVVYLTADLVAADADTGFGTDHERLLCAIVSRLIWFAIIKVTLLIWKEYRDAKVSLTDWGEALFVPVSSVFIAAAVINTEGRYGEWIRLLAACLIIVVNIFTFYLYDRTQENAVAAAQKEYLKRQSEHYARMNEEIGRYWLEIRSFKRDLKQRYLLEQNYLQQGNYEKLKSYYEESLDILKKDYLVAHTGNVCIDNLINYKAMTAEKSKITIKTDLKVPYNMQFNEEDLYSLTGNLLDNAIEAAQEVIDEEKTIIVKIRADYRNLLLVVSNPYNGERIIDETGYGTVKKNKKEHGIGLKIIEGIVKKYKGEITIDSSGHWFHVKILLYDVELNSK